MKQQVLSGAIPPHWWERLKGAQFGFIGGIIVGLFLGWFFHGVISLAIRFGLLLILLLPLLVIGWLWLRSQRTAAPAGNQSPVPRAKGWTAVVDVEREPSRSSSEPATPELIDVPFERPTRPSAPSSTTPPPRDSWADIEAELETLKRERGA